MDKETVRKTLAELRDDARKRASSPKGEEITKYHPEDHYSGYTVMRFGDLRNTAHHLQRINSWCNSIAGEVDNIKNVPGGYLSDEFMGIITDLRAEAVAAAEVIAVMKDHLEELEKKADSIDRKV